jgi:hypothetical protein
MKTENVIKWEKTGLLQFLIGNQKEECANLLEDVGNLLIKKYQNNTTPKSEMICGTILPITRKLFSENIKTIPTADWLYEDYINFVENHPELNPLNQDLSGKDYEGELCSIYTKSVVEKLNK